MLEKRDDIIYGVSNAAHGNLSFSFGNAKEVVENRAAFLSEYGLNVDDAVVMCVVHGDDIAVVDERDKRRGMYSLDDAIPVDALLTSTRGVTLFLLIADCFPVAFFDPTHNAIALAHLGWRPTGLRLVEKVVRQMQEAYGSDPSELLVEVGPGIHKDSYILHDPEQKHYEQWQPYLEHVGDGNVKIDVRSFNKDQLVNAGVKKDHISTHASDTGVDRHYFSHYRAVREDEPEGRFATIIALEHAQKTHHRK